MKAIEMAHKIIEEFETADVFEIAERSNLRIVYESWQPITLGEFDKKRKTITVNRQAMAEDKSFDRKIVAHELGHYFASPFGYDRKSEEIFAVEFAAELMKFI